MLLRARVPSALLLPLVLLAGGCVSLTPPQETSVAEIRALADETARTYGVARIYSAGRGLVPWGHLAPCAEIGDLLARFPAQRSWTSSLECAVGSATASGPVLDAHSAPR